MPSPVAARAKSERLESPHNRWLKRFRAALHGESDAGDAVLGLEGAKLVMDALRSGLPLEALLVSDSGERQLAKLKSLLPAATRILRTSDRLFSSVAGTETPQGIAAMVHRPEWMWDALLSSQPLLIVLAGVQDPGNVGAIVRSAEALGASGLIACRSSSDPFGPKAVRASAGSVLRLPVLAESPAPQAVFDELRRRALHQYAATLSGERLPHSCDLSRSCALWIGGEGAGLPVEIASAADARIRIPLRPAVESLNAAAAATILLYEAGRQRNGAGRAPASVEEHR